MTLNRALLALLSAGLLSAMGNPALASEPPLPQHFYYPYMYFPHSYWPAQAPRYPEAPGQPYQKPPAYMHYPAFKEANWRYELWTPMKWYRGNHFWLDQF